MTIFDGQYEAGKKPGIRMSKMKLAALDRDGICETDAYIPLRAFNMKWAPNVDLLSKSQGLEVVGQMTKGIDVDDVDASSALSENNKLAAAYIQLLAHKKPDPRVLTVGLQSGIASLTLLSLLFGPRGGVAPFAVFNHTDTNFDLGQAAKAKFPAWADLITFIDVKTECGVPQMTRPCEDAYDVVVVFNVLASSKPVVQTLNAGSNLLLSGGRMIFVDHEPQ
jgi:hypothetical protein